MKPSQSTSGSRLRRHSSTNEENALSHGYPRQHVLESDKSVRERAKDVLRWMYPHNIDFTTLVEEGINAEVLLELYKEIGIQISPSMYTNEATEKIRLMEPENAREPSSVVSSLSRDQKYNQNRVVAVESSQRNQKSSQGLLVHRVSHEVSNSKTLSDQQLPAQKELETLSNNTTDNGMKAYPLLSAEIRNADTLPKLNAPTTAPKPPHTNQLGKSIPGKTGDKVMERKDYIARMLAAKAGKPIPVASTSTATNVSTKHPTENIVVPAQPEKFAHIDNIEERRLLIENIPLMATEPDFRDFFSGFTM